MDARPTIPSNSDARRRLGHVTWLVLGIELFAAVFVAVAAGGSAVRVLQEAAVPVSADDLLKQRLIGVWEDDYYGRRRLTLRPDGTGTMIVELQGLHARLFTPRLRFEEQWHVTEGKLVLQVVGGEPPAKIEFVIQLKGDRSEQPILEVTDSRLLVLDQDGETHFDWRRVPMQTSDLAESRPQ